MARRKQISDEAVLETAMKVMTAKGPGDFTLADVGRATGLAPATLVQRFGDKHGLVVAAIAHDNRSFARLLEGLPPTTGAAAVIAVFRLLTPQTSDLDSFADQLLWLRQDMKDPALNRLARERFALLRRAVAERMPPLPMPAEDAARLVEAQWQGALNQWGLEREGDLATFVTRSLAAGFALVAGAGSRERERP
ncbi:MAG TPA: TetR family transcriptional regulator [Caulobacteraceae bacterium]|nr:TetR family transcriptional regulator [Caulobacteraceae bacterium]